MENNEPNNIGNRVAKEELLELLNTATPLSEALEQVGEYRASYIVRLISEIEGRPNTRGCSLAGQYNGCGGITVVKDKK